MLNMLNRVCHEITGSVASCAVELYPACTCFKMSAQQNFDYPLTETESGEAHCLFLPKDCNGVDLFLCDFHAKY